MFKDKGKQKEANREASKRARDKRKGMTPTPEGMTEGMTQEQGSTMNPTPTSMTQGMTEGMTLSPIVNVIPETEGIEGMTVGMTDKSFAEHYRPAPKNLKGAKVTLDGYHEITFTLVNAIYREAEGKAMLSGMPVEDWCRRLVLRECKRK